MRPALIASALLLTACSPRVIERVKLVEVATPVAAPCPRPEDVRPMPAKPAGDLPQDARQALAVVMAWLVELVPWAEGVERQQAACSQVSSNP